MSVNTDNDALPKNEQHDADEKSEAVVSPIVVGDFSYSSFSERFFLILNYLQGNKRNLGFTDVSTEIPRIVMQESAHPSPPIFKILRIKRNKIIKR